MRDTLKSFTELPLIEASEELLNKLGIKFTPLVKGVPFNSFFTQNSFNYQYANEASSAVDTIWHIGYVDDRTFQDSVIGLGSQSLSIFACEINPNANFTRGLAAALTRAFTRVNTRQVNFNYDMPVVVIMKQVSLLTLATCELTDRLDGNGKKVGKVTMLRNMDCNNLHAGHRQILERIAYDVQGCNNYDELHEKWFKSFSIDVLSDKFFEGYKNIYEDIIEYITGKRMVKDGNKWLEHNNGEPCVEIMDEFSIFADPEKAVRDYVKNLMGRLVFIQFLQKKGWMGVPAGDSWEGGDPDFLQNLFKNSDKKETFIDDVLEPLFNDLNTKRHRDLVTNQNVSNNIKIKVPYLNGGLFELDKSDDTKFPLPAYFMQKLLAFFASFNFTIDENAPDDVEIGVDPEMLGRIFENLLEDNKDKGAFYTPKKIVQYMCRESLVAYLTTCVMNRQGEDHRPEEEIHNAVRRLLTDPGAVIPKMTPQHLEDFGRYIRDVKICDPAIGSGAFPMGLLNELVRCRIIINAWATDSYGNMLVGNIAALKAEIIRNNIYGVDIERGAIDIARLRFWLSIIVDEKTPEALPNFDYKFMQGNSLIPTFAGQFINLSTKSQQHKYVQQMKEVKRKIYKFKQDFYSASGAEKMKLNILIKDHILKLISLQLGYEIQSWAEAHAEQLSLDFGVHPKITVKDAINQLPENRKRIVELGKSLREKLADKTISLEHRAQTDIQFFDWRMMFTEVFDKEDGGFDIVIGNPPYFVYEGNNNEDLPIIREQDEYTIAFGGKLNAYKLFLACALKKLIKKDGINCFIFQNSFLADLQAVNLRKYVLDNCQILLIDSFPERDSVRKRVFESVKMSVCITLIRNTNTNNSFVVNVWNDKNKTSGISTRFTADEIERIDSHYLTIPRLKEEAKPIIIKMIAQRALFVKCLEGELNVTTHRPFFSNDPSLPVIMKGAGIQKYYYTFEMSQGQIEHLYEKGYLDRFGSSDKAHHHEQSRIVMQGMTGANDKIRLVMSIIPPNIYLGHSCKYILPSNDISQECLLGLLNSKLANFFFRCFSTNSNVNGYEIEAIPICKVQQEISDKIEALVSKISLIKGENHSADTSEYESKIDEIIYHLYGLTYDEVLVVDPEPPITRDEYDNFNIGS